MSRHKYIDDILDICYKKHLTLDEIYFFLKRKYKKVGFATVYRTCEYLYNLGKLRKIEIGGLSYYETFIDRHYHFYDIDSGKIYDIENIIIDENVYDIVIIGKGKNIS